MSQKKTEEVLSHDSNVIPTNHQRKFVNLPLMVFKDFTNIRQLAVEKLKAKGKTPYEVAIERVIKSYHDRLLQLDEWDDDVLNRLEYIDWPEDNKIDASIWSLSSREQERVFDKATDHQKQFLCLPLHVLKNATNIQSLLDAAAKENFNTLDDFVLKIHKKLPKITKWLPQLNHLRFEDSSDLNTSQLNLTVQSPTRASAIPKREMRKRKPRSLKRIRTQSETEPLAQGIAFKRSKIPRIETKRNPEIVSFVPIELQREVQNMNLDQFATKTNIKEIIEKEYRDRLMNENAIVPDDEMNNRLMFYFALRIQTRDWHKNGLKNLELIESDQKPAVQAESSEASADATNETDDRSKLDASNSNSTNDQNYEPTNFQKQVIAMDFDTFVKTTNVKELVILRFEQEFEGAKELDEDSMKFGLKRYYSLRMRTNKWHKNLLKHLQIIPKVCECRQNKTFVDKFTQTDSVKTDDVEVQCHPSELGLNEMVKSGQKKQQHQTLEAKLAKLSTKTCNEYVSMMSESNEEDPNITDDLSMDDPQDIDLKAGAPNSNSDEPLNEPIQATIQSEQGTSSKQSDDFVAENLLETQEILENVDDDVAMSDEGSSYDNVNTSTQEVDLVEKSAEPSSNEVEPRLVVEKVQQESFEMMNMEVELNPQNQSQSQSKRSIAMVLSPSKIEVDVSTQPENSTDNPAEAKTTPTNGDNSMDGFDPQKNSTAVDLSMGDESVKEEVQEMVVQTFDKMPIQSLSNSEKSSTKPTQSAVRFEQDKLTMPPPAQSQQIWSNVNVKTEPINTIAEDAEMVQITKDPLISLADSKNNNVAQMQEPVNLSQCGSWQQQKNAKLSNSSGNESKTTVKKASNRQGKENDPPETERRAQQTAHIVQDEQYFFEKLYADTPHADQEQMHKMAKFLASIASTR